MTSVVAPRLRDLAKVEIEAVLLGSEFAIGLVGTRKEPLEQALARGGGEVGGGLGQGGGGIGPSVKQAGLGLGQHAAEKAEIGDRSANEGTAQHDTVFAFDGSVEPRVARAETLYGHHPAV